MSTPITPPPSDKAYTLAQLADALGLWDDPNGFNRYVAGDGNTYVDGVARFVKSGNQAISSLPGVAVTGLSGIALAAATYEFEAQIHCTQGGTADQQGFFLGYTLGASATARTFLVYSFQQEIQGGVPAPPNVQMNNIVNGDQWSDSYAAGSRWTLLIKGTLGVTTAMTAFGVWAHVTTSGHNFTVLGGSRMSVMPV